MFRSFPAVLTWGVWAVLTLAAVVGAAREGRNVPLGDDWDLVPAVTGHQRDLAAWLWEQKGDDREPLPRVGLVAAIAAAQDFRAGAVLAAILVSALAAAMILTAAALRGHRTRFRDVFLPLLLLHPGHWIGLGSAHTLSGALTAALTSVLLFGILFDPALCTRRWALGVVSALVLLPLTGTLGLLLALVVSPWVAHCGWRHWPPRYPQVPHATGPGLLAAVGLTLLVVGLYFAGYDQAPWVFPEPAVLPALRGTMAVFASAAGPAALGLAGITLPLIGVVLVGTCGVLGMAVLRLHDDERERAVGLSAFVSAYAVVALLIGWRAAAEPMTAATPAWAVLAAPAACAAFFIWELYGPPLAAVAVQASLLAALLVLAPRNTAMALAWRAQYHAAAAWLERDIAAGKGVSSLAAAHAGFLAPNDARSVERGMALLLHGRVGPFSRARADDARESGATSR